MSDPEKNSQVFSIRTKMRRTLTKDANESDTQFNSRCDAFIIADLSEERDKLARFKNAVLAVVELDSEPPAE